ncbi:MAG TPA: PQQ-binding-like beta-propeller repeat protein [Actinomycetota bacterium]|nr:PQQ-binding-like beta-propeller repeat protein [Actinomycetota bacterium]
MLAWTIAVLAVAGLTVPAVIATESAARVADPGVERYAPTQPGSTSVFTTRTNGKDTGLEYEQVAGRAQVVSLTPNTVAIADHFDDFVGSGSPLDVRTYEALDGDRLLSFGSRSGTNEFQQSTPPEVLLQPPLSKGASWTWHGKRQGRTGRTVTTIEEVADRTVLGRGFDDCLRIRVTSHEADANNVASTDVTESWTCPDAGLVQTVEDFTQGTTTIHYEANIVAVHRPGLNLRGPGAPPVPATGGEAHLGQTDGIDAGKTWFVPGAKLSTSHLAWSISRTLDALYQPIANGNDVITAEDDGTIAEIDVRTGQVVWQVGLTGPIVASPTAAGGLLLVGDSSKTLWALDPATGRTVWAIRLPDVVAATPAVLDGIAVVATDDRAVRGIELSTGRQVWSGSTSALVVSPPVVAGDLVVVGDQDGNLRALRPRDGSTAWSSSSFPLLTSGTSLLGGLSAGGGLVLAATDGAAVFAFDASNGRLEWRSLAPGTIDRPVAIAGDRVVVAADNSVVALDLRTGARVWRRDTDTSFAPPIVLGDTAAVLQTNNLLLTFALADGTESKMRIGAPSRQTDQDTQLPMTWAAGSLIVPTHNVGPWPFSIYQAFPAPVGSAAAQPARGVRLAGDFYGPGGPPSGPSSLGEGRMLEAPMAVFSENSASGKIVESHPGGPDTSPTRVLFHTTSIPGYAVAAGDRVITQVGSEVLGVPLRGGKPWVAQGGRIAVAPAVVPAAAGHPPVAVIADVQEGLTGVDASTGAHLWGPIAKPAAGGFGSPIVLPDGTVAWGGGGVTVLDPASGRILRQNTKVSPVTTLATDAGGLYAVAFAGSDFALARFDATTLQPVWANKFSPATIGGALPIGPGAGDGIVAAVDSKAALHAFDGATGKELWSLQLRMIPNSAPVVWQGRVYVEEPGFGEDIDQHEHRITVLDAHTGAFEASWAIPGANYSLGAFSQSRDRVLVSLPTGVGAIAPEQR